MPQPATSDKIAHAHDLLHQGVARLAGSDEFRAYLTAQARFHHYSATNTILLITQNPTITRVAGYTAWQKLGRQVRKGEHGLMIFAPHFSKRTTTEDEADDSRRGFHVARVFDISQTDGDDLPPLPGCARLDTSTDKGRELLAMLTSWCTTNRIPLAIQPIAGPELGSYNPNTHSITVDSDQSIDQQAKTLLHEIAHATMHGHSGQPDEPRPTAEVEAESVAFIVSSALGLDTSSYSFGYVLSWQNNADLLAQSADRIQATAHQLIEHLTQEGTP